MVHLRMQRQQAVMERFKGGGLNLLLATAVAEEGLDLTRCRLVVRFNLPRTPLEFIQSRGRARARDSRLVLLVEDGRDGDVEMLRAVHQCASFRLSITADAAEMRSSVPSELSFKYYMFCEQYLSCFFRSSSQERFQVPAEPKAMS